MAVEADKVESKMVIDSFRLAAQQFTHGTGDGQGGSRGGLTHYFT